MRPVLWALRPTPPCPRAPRPCPSLSASTWPPPPSGTSRRGRAPLPHLVAREGDQVEGLGVPICGYGRVVLYPHHGRVQPMVADDLGGQLLGDVGDGCSLVGGQLRANNH